MKKSKMFAFCAGTVTAVAIAFSGISLNASASTKSMSELSAKADSYCAYCGSCALDCQSDATGSIYPHYEVTNY